MQTLRVNSFSITPSKKSSFHQEPHNLKQIVTRGLLFASLFSFACPLDECCWFTGTCSEPAVIVFPAYDESLMFGDIIAELNNKLSGVSIRPGTVCDDEPPGECRTGHIVNIEGQDVVDDGMYAVDNSVIVVKDGLFYQGFSEMSASEWCQEHSDSPIPASPPYDYSNDCLYCDEDRVKIYADGLYFDMTELNDEELERVVNGNYYSQEYLDYMSAIIRDHGWDQQGIDYCASRGLGVGNFFVNPHDSRLGHTPVTDEEVKRRLAKLFMCCETIVYHTDTESSTERIWINEN